MAADSDLGRAFYDVIQLVRRRVLPPVLLLAGLQADEVADHARAVQKPETRGPLPRKSRRLFDFDDVHLELETTKLEAGNRDAKSGLVACCVLHVAA
jgi:hypothetical protein